MNTSSLRHLRVTRHAVVGDAVVLDVGPLGCEQRAIVQRALHREHQVRRQELRRCPRPVAVRVVPRNRKTLGNHDQTLSVLQTPVSDQHALVAVVAGDL
jgi:hypothetical protein